MWEERLQELLAFRAAHGHVNVPRRWPENPRLAQWVINQRRQVRTGSLTPARLAQLRKLAIAWPSADERSRGREGEWDRMFDALAAYGRDHGHFDVPGGSGSTAKLARWVACQRHLQRRGTLRADRLRRLQELGVDWSPDPGSSRSRNRAWNLMYDALAAFSRAHGHCRVPKEWPENPPLARWVVRQRHHLRTRPMRPDRRARLDQLGFARPLPAATPAARVPSRRERAWRSMYASLQEFRQIHGHSRVPRRCPGNPRLARWIHHQRGLRRRGLLHHERERLLTLAGVEWIVERSLPPPPRTAVRTRRLEPS